MKACSHEDGVMRAAKKKGSCMSIRLNKGIDDCNKLENSAGTTEKTEVNYEKSVAGKVMEMLFENRMRREWLTTKEAAQYLLISENALRIMVHRNQVQVARFGRRLRFRLEDCRLLVLTKGA